MADAPRPIIIIKKKKKGHAGHHGGAWKVAYADFVTAMMALFIVLWLLTQAETKMKKDLAQYFRDPGVFKGGKSMFDKTKGDTAAAKPTTLDLGIGAPDEKAVEEKLLKREEKRLQDMVNEEVKNDPQLKDFKDSVRIRTTAQGLQIEIIDKGKNVLFDSASAELKPGLVKLLKRMAAVLATLPNSIQVEGHTDKRPLVSSSGRTNWDLSFERANAARKVLEANGLREGQLERVLSYADSDPSVPSDPYAAENRRLSITALRHAADPSKVRIEELTKPHTQLRRVIPELNHG